MSHCGDSQPFDQTSVAVDANVGPGGGDDQPDDQSSGAPVSGIDSMTDEYVQLSSVALEDSCDNAVSIYDTNGLVNVYCPTV